MNALNNLDFDEWVNIPRPLVQTLILFKQCFLEQSRKISDCYTEIDNSNNKIHLKLRTMTESLANTNEIIRNQQESIFKKVKERCDFLSSDFSQFKKKIKEENNNKQKVLNENLYEMKEQANRCVKAVGKIVDLDEINKIISERALVIHQNVFNDVRDQQIRPTIEKLTHDMKISSEKLSRALEATNNLIKSVESHSQEDIHKVLNNLSELRTHTIQNDSHFSEYIEKNDQEIQTLNSQIDLLQRTLINCEKNTDNNFFNINNDIAQVMDNYSALNKKVENFEHNQSVRSRTAAPITISKPLIKDDHPNLNSHKPPSETQNKASPISQEAQESLFKNTLLIENELKSYRFKMELEMKFLKNELLKTIKEEIHPLEEKISHAQNLLETTSFELKDKLSWLPINISELSGMGPLDARLFTIEARLRAEENSRIKALSTIEKSLDSIRKTSFSPLLLKSSDRKATPEPTLETLHSISEIEEMRLPAFDRAIYTSCNAKRIQRKNQKSLDLNKDVQNLSLRKVLRHKSFKN